MAQRLALRACWLAGRGGVRSLPVPVGSSSPRAQNPAATFGAEDSLASLAAVGGEDDLALGAAFAVAPAPAQRRGVGIL